MSYIIVNAPKEYEWPSTVAAKYSLKRSFAPSSGEQMGGCVSAEVQASVSPASHADQSVNAINVELQNEWIPSSLIPTEIGLYL